MAHHGHFPGGNHMPMPTQIPQAHSVPQTGTWTGGPNHQTVQGSFANQGQTMKPPGMKPIVPTLHAFRIEKRSRNELQPGQKESWDRDCVNFKEIPMPPEELAQTLRRYEDRLRKKGQSISDAYEDLARDYKGRPMRTHRRRDRVDELIERQRKQETDKNATWELRALELDKVRRDKNIIDTVSIRVHLERRQKPNVTMKPVQPSGHFSNMNNIQAQGVTGQGHVNQQNQHGQFGNLPPMGQHAQTNGFRQGVAPPANPPPPGAIPGGHHQHHQQPRGPPGPVLQNNGHFQGGQPVPPAPPPLPGAQHYGNNAVQPIRPLPREQIAAYPRIQEVHSSDDDDEYRSSNPVQIVHQPRPSVPQHGLNLPIRSRQPEVHPGVHPGVHPRVHPGVPPPAPYPPRAHAGPRTYTQHADAPAVPNAPNININVGDLLDRGNRREPHRYHDDHRGKEAGGYGSGHRSQSRSRFNRAAQKVKDWERDSTYSSEDSLFDADESAFTRSVYDSPNSTPPQSPLMKHSKHRHHRRHHNFARRDADDPYYSSYDNRVVRRATLGPVVYAKDRAHRRSDSYYGSEYPWDLEDDHLTYNEQIYYDQRRREDAYHTQGYGGRPQRGVMRRNGGY